MNNAERDARRASCEVVIVSREPWTFTVSIDGSWVHHLWWSKMLGDVVCETCLDRQGRVKCWARARCLEVLRAAVTARREAMA